MTVNLPALKKSVYKNKLRDTNLKSNHQKIFNTENKRVAIVIRSI